MSCSALWDAWGVSLGFMRCTFFHDFPFLSLAGRPLRTLCETRENVNKEHAKNRNGIIQRPLDRPYELLLRALTNRKTLNSPSFSSGNNSCSYSTLPPPPHPTPRKKNGRTSVSLAQKIPEEEGGGTKLRMSALTAGSVCFLAP